MFSTLFIVIGITISALSGSYQLGVDFKGGHSFVVKFDEPVKAEDVRHAIAGNFKESSLEVKTYNSPSQLRITTSYLMDSEVENADKLVKQSLENGLAELSELNPEVVGYSKVGASIANDIKASSKTAIIIAFIIIFLYILIRFHRWEYSLGATVALLHDVLMIFAFYGLAGVFGLHLEIDQAFIAAVLTIIGYSINDTVVIYDRIREFAGKALDKTQFAGIVNPAVNNTLSRTVITSFTVFIVTIILLFFSGEVLRGFSFALLVGVVFGTYSSIFIASPSAVDFMKEKRRIIRMTKSEKKAA